MLMKVTVASPLHNIFKFCANLHAHWLAVQTFCMTVAGFGTIRIHFV